METTPTTESDTYLKELTDISEKQSTNQSDYKHSEKLQLDWKELATKLLTIVKWRGSKQKNLERTNQLERITQSILLLVEATRGENQETRETLLREILKIIGLHQAGHSENIKVIANKFNEIDKSLERLRVCPACIAKDAHIQDLKLLLASERQNFHEFNRTIHERTGIIRGKSESGTTADDDDRPVRLGNMPFSELKRLAEAKSREVAESRTRESKQVEEHQKQAGAKYIGEGDNATDLQKLQSE
jgi:hypothetical protein